LRDAICALDWDRITLPVARDPNEYETLYIDKYDYGYTSSSWGLPNKTKGNGTRATMIDAYDIPTIEELLEHSATDLGDWVLAADPLDVAYLLKDMAEQLAELHYGYDYMTQEKYNA
jgi:hypothetical protein